MDGIGPIRPTEPQIFRKQRESSSDGKPKPPKQNHEIEPQENESEEISPKEELLEGGIDLEV